MRGLFVVLLVVWASSVFAESQSDRLIEGLGDKNWTVRVKSALALGKMRERRAVESLVNALGDENYYVRKCATTALIRIGKPSFDLLTASLEDTDWRVRRNAAYALGEMNDANAVGFLARALGDENLYVANEVKAALVKIGEPSVNSVVVLLRDNDIDVQKNAGYVLSQIGKPAVKPLIDMLKDADSCVVIEAIWALGEIGDNRAIDPLLFMLKNKNNLIRWETVSALGKIGDERVIKFIKPMLNDEDNHIKGIAKEVIASITAFKD